MHNPQEYKIVNLRDSTEVFFFRHSFKSAREHADLYMARNLEEFPMRLYELNIKPTTALRWIAIDATKPEPKIVTVKNLITQLSKCNPDLPVNIYCECETYWISGIDDSMNDRVDINCEDL